MNRLKFFHLRSEKGLARQSKRSAVDLEDLRKQIESIEERIQKEDITKGVVEETKRDILSLLDLIEGETESIRTIEKDSAIQYYELLNKIGDVEKELQDIKSKKSADFSAEIESLKRLSSQIQSWINKSRIDARNAMNDREKIVKYKAFLGYHLVAREIRRTEKEIKREIGDEKALLADIKSHEDDENLIKKDLAEFSKIAEKEAKDIYKVEHDAIIFTFYVLNKLNDAYKIIQEIQQEGFPADKTSEIVGKFNEAKAKLQDISEESYKMEKYMKKRAHKLAA